MISIFLRHEHGYSVASFDKIYGRPMDFLSNPGFSMLSYIRVK